MDDDTLSPFDVPSPMPGGTTRERPALLPQMARALLGIAAVACTAGSVMMLSLVPDGAGMGAMFAVLSLLSLGLTRAPKAWLPTALSAVLLLVMLGMAAAAVACNWGLGAPGLPLFGLIVCVACAAVSVRTGLVLAGIGASLVGVVALWVPAGLAISAPPSMAMQLGTQWLGILSGLAAGVMISRTVARYTSAAQGREDRFSSLLALAADVYWELDENYHLVGTAQQGSALQRFPGPSMLPWEMPRLGWDADTLDLLRAELEAREPFRDVQVTWAQSDGGKRVFLISGEPRFGERGVFTGYWGVARDVTEIEAARRALEDTETRYEDLFSRIPTPLVMQRDGYVFDANPAALAMFGSPDLESLIGTDLVSLVESGEGRERARRRLETLRNEPAGAALQ